MPPAATITISNNKCRRATLNQLVTRARQLLNWIFRNRETGAITIAQAPNWVLWVVIVAAILFWVVPSTSQISFGLTIIVRSGLLVWAADEIIWGVNPWRRFLGATVATYVLWSLLE